MADGGRNSGWGEGMRWALVAAAGLLGLYVVGRFFAARAAAENWSWNDLYFFVFRWPTLLLLAFLLLILVRLAVWKGRRDRRGRAEKPPPPG